MGPKTKIFTYRDRALKKHAIFKKEFQNRMKNYRVMPIRSSRVKVAVGLFWAKSWIFCILATFFKISPSNLFCSLFTLRFTGKLN